jgi:ribosome recycling factor
MEKTISYLQSDLQGVRAGRANPHVLDKIRVDYYGSPTPIQQVANISVPEARIIQIAPWEKRMIKEISRAINASDIGINPTNDGNCVRLVFPELNEERRKDLAKQIKKYGEEAKVAIRNIRRDAIETLKKDIKNGLPEDVEKDAENTIQKAHDKFIKNLEAVYAAKDREIMSV